MICLKFIEIRKIPRADGFGGEPGRFEEVKDEQKCRNGNKIREQFKLEIKM